MEEIAIVTGALEGLGAAKATVAALVHKRYRGHFQGVVVVVRRLELLEQVANGIKEKGGKALVNVASASSWRI